MLILLSSARMPRYRNDILRCISAPIGATIQFRYSKHIVSKEIWDNPEDFQNKIGLVCSADLDHPGEKSLIIPVRRVKIEKIFKHGSTLSLSMRVEKIVCLTKDVKDKAEILTKIESFTKVIDQNSGGKVPICSTAATHTEGMSGYFFFKYRGKTDVINELAGKSLTDWENLTAILLNQPGYLEEKFFWTVLGIEKTSSDLVVRTDYLNQWDSKIKLNSEYTILVYVFHPSLDKWNSNSSQLIITSSLDLSANYSQDIVVDSPYDLKRWSFKISSKDIFDTDRAWIEIGPKSAVKTPSEKNATDEETPPEWKITLPLEINSLTLRFFITTFALGFLLSLTAIIGVIIQDKVTVNTKIFSVIIILIAGSLAAFVIRAGLRPLIRL